MSSKIETIRDIRDRLEPVSQIHTPSYEEIREEYVANPELHPLFTAVLPIEGLKKDESAYNPFAFVDKYGQLQLLLRCEPDDPKREDSVVRLATWEGENFVIKDFRASRRSRKTTRLNEIKNAQDPNLTEIGSDQPTLSFVEIECGDPEQPGKVTEYHQKFVPFMDGKLRMSRAVKGESNRKDVRITYVGNNRRIISPRERIVTDQNLDSVASYQEALILAADQFQAIEKQINYVVESPESVLPSFSSDPQLWFGSNHWVPLRRDNGVHPMGSIEHSGRRKLDQVCENGRAEREYAVLTRESEFSVQRGEILTSSTPRIVTMASDFKEDIKPKTPDLKNVTFPGNLIFAFQDNGRLAYTLLFTGVKDRVPGLSVIRYPFSILPDLELNRNYILSAKKARQLLTVLQNLKAA